MRFIQHLFLTLMLCFATAAPGMAAEAEKKVEMQLVRNAEGAFASVALQFALPEQIEDALYKGVALYFVEEAEIISERWYWRDKTVQKAARYLRLSYQPLTRRWRLHVSSSPLNEAGMAASLGQSFETMDEALAIVKRVRSWKIADAADLSDSADYLVKFSFRLDSSLLPRIFQFAPFGNSGLNLQIRSQLPLPEASTP
ncbi:DUF4390 domain-containing protein [Comamonas sp. 4034]|uniref:DUF4390 domain-containing protein n=1 Tax=Comamonas sp. 4034 TaxID=3156455 RepID=UPI003D20A742